MKRLLVSVLLAAVPSAFAFDADSAWPSGTRNFRLLLDRGSVKEALPDGGLTDGAANWDAVAQEMARQWNLNLNRIQISLTSTSGSPGNGDGRNDIAFSNTAYGEDFGERTLAITFSRWESGINRVRKAESDILFNTSINWDSYRGRLRTAVDIQRVLLHEMGHAIGLGHPDQAHPPQTVNAIMNSSVSNVDALTADDLAGARVLYGEPISIPTITRQPVGGTVNESSAADIFIETNGGAAPPSSPILSYSWLYTPSGGGSAEWLFGQPEARIPLGTVQTTDAGTYRVRIETPDGDVSSSSAILNVLPVANNSATRLYNLSTRGFVAQGERALVVGFVIQTQTTRRVLIRGIGPGLVPLGVGDALPDPVLDVRRAAGDVSLGASDTWSSENKGATAEVFRDAGAFALPDGSADAALVLDLPAGNYTATLTPKPGTNSGTGLVEVYDISPTRSPTERLYNLSTRGYVASESQILVAGLAVRGPGPRTFLLRGAGDTLKQFSINETLDDPVLRLFNEGGTVLRYADDWDNPEGLQDTLRTTMSRVGAFAFTDRQESALLLKLQPGNYTLHLAGFKGGVGTALVEIYEVDD